MPSTTEAIPNWTAALKLRWRWYVPAAVILYVSMCNADFVSVLSGRLAMFPPGWSRCGTVYAALIALSLCAGNVRQGVKWRRVAGGMTSLLAAAFALSVLIISVVQSCLGLSDWTRGGAGYRIALTIFVSRAFPLKPFHVRLPIGASPTPPFQVGSRFWEITTPLAIPIAFLLFWWLRKSIRLGRPLAEPLARLLLAVSMATAPLVVGTLLAGEQSDTLLFFDLVNGFPPLPVVMLGALSAWARSAPLERTENHSQSASAVNPDVSKIVNSASQAALATLVLLVFGIVQTAGYADVENRLIEARAAFANDLTVEALDEQKAPGHGSNPPDCPNVLSVSAPWATAVTICRIEDGIEQHYQSPFYGSPLYEVRVDESVRRDHWSEIVKPADPTQPDTRNIADREGVTYTGQDTPVRIFPRIEAALLSKEASVPGVGLSVNLNVLTLLMPFLVFVALGLLRFYLGIILTYYSPPSEPWLLLRADTGIPGLLARVWLGALAFSPMVLAAYAVDVVALDLRTKGGRNTVPLEIAGVVYSFLTIAILLVPTVSVIRDVVALRRLDQEHPQRRAVSVSAD